MYIPKYSIFSEDNAEEILTFSSLYSDAQVITKTTKKDNMKPKTKFIFILRTHGSITDGIRLISKT